MSKAIMEALEALETEKGIKKEIIIDALENALISAYKRHYGQAQNVEVIFNTTKADIKVYSVKEVVEQVFDSMLEISLVEAQKINKKYQIGDKVKFEVTPKDFGRIAAQTAKQVIMQRVREVSRQNIYDEYIKYENEIMSGTVERKDSRYIYVNLGKVEAIMSEKDQIPHENYQSHDRIKVFVYRVNNSNKGPSVFVSRSHPDFLRRLFEQEVSEIYDGIVEIKSIAREAGDRSKIAVKTNDKNIDAVGTTVGHRGSRVQAIVKELHGENLDIIEWNEDPVIFIKNALKPAKVTDVVFDLENEHVVTVFVPDDAFSLAIGKHGQNVRLASHLTNFKIDIKKDSQQDEFWDKYEAKQAELEKLAQEKVAHDKAKLEEPTDEEIISADNEVDDEILIDDAEIVETINEETNRVDKADEAATSDLADVKTKPEIAVDLADEAVATLDDEVEHDVDE